MTRYKIIRIAKTYPRKDREGIGQHVFYFSKFIKFNTLVFLKKEKSKISKQIKGVDYVEVNHFDYKIKTQSIHFINLFFVGILKFSSDLSFFCKILFKIYQKNIKFDNKAIIHLHSINYLLTAILLKKIFKLNLIINFGGTDLYRIKSIPIFRNLINYADAISYVSIDMKQLLANLYPNVKSFYVGNAVDLEIFKPQYSFNSKNIIAIGNLRWQKNYSFMIDLFYLFSKRNDYVLTIVGDGPEILNIKSQINKFGLSNKVFLVGYKSRTEISELLRKSKFLLLTSKNEGFPKVILESISSGTPVISIYNNQIKSILNKKGITIKNHDLNLFIKAMNYVCTKNIYDKFYKNCLNDRKYYSWLNMSKRLKDIYIYIINK
jgi:hypothetical protein